MSDQIHQAMASRKGNDELPQVAEDFVVPIGDRADAGQVEDEEDNADDHEQHAILPACGAWPRRSLRQPAQVPAVILMVAERQFAATRGIVMNSYRFATIVTACMLSAPAWANQDLAQKKNCMACHAVAQKVIGPSYKEVAAKYAGQADAVAKLVPKVMKGGAGVWGAVPMPANPQVSEAEAKQLVAWILTLK